MTLTEAAACGTPAVVTRIAGHADAVVDGRTGLLADDPRRARGARSTGCSPTTTLRGAARRPARASTRRASPGRRRHAARSRCSRRGRDPASHATRDRRRSPSARPAPQPNGLAARHAARVSRGLGYARARAARVRPAAAHRAGQGRRRHQAVPLPRSRPAARARAVDVGPEHRARHGHPPEHRLPVPDGPVLLGARHGSACPTGSRSGSGSARILLFAGLGVLYLLRTLGRPRPGRRRRRARVHAHAVLARLRGAHLGDPAAVGGAAVADRVRDPQALRDGGWRYPALFAIVVQVVGSVNATALVFAGIAPAAVDRRTRVLVDARGRLAARARATVAKIGVLTLAHVAVVDRRALGPGQLRPRHPAVHRDGRDGRRARRCRTRSCAASATGSSTARTSSAPGSSRASTTRSDRLAHRGRATGSPILALLVAPAFVRWRHRAFFVVRHARRRRHRGRRAPLRHPTPLGAAVQGVRRRLDVGLALRSTGRAVAARRARPRGAARRRRERGRARWSHARRVPRSRPRRRGHRRSCSCSSTSPRSGTARSTARTSSAPRTSRSTGRTRRRTSTRGPHDTRVLELPGAGRSRVLTVLASLWWIAGLVGPERLRPRHPPVHRDAGDGGAHVAAERGAPRPRLLVLLRRRQVGPWIDPSVRLHPGPAG